MKLRNGNIRVALASVIVIAEEFGRDRKTQSSRSPGRHLRTGDSEVEVAENLYQRVYSMIASMITGP